MAREREKGLKDQIYLGSSYIFNHTYYNSVQLSTFIPDPEVILKNMTVNFNPNATNAVEMFGLNLL